MIFNIYHVFAPFMKLCGCRFLYFFSLWDVRNEAVFLFLEHSSLRGGKQKKHVKNMKFWPYNKRSDWKTSLAERFSEALTSKLWNKKKYCQNWIICTTYGLIKNLLQIHSRDSHMEFTGKNKVGNTTWTKLCGLIGRKLQSSFQ